MTNDDKKQKELGAKKYNKMKGNNGSGNIEERDDWQTPKWLFNRLNETYGFVFDCCATHKNTKCQMWEDNFENQGHTDVMSWMNPPFSKAREMFKHFFKVIKFGVAIYRCDNLETALWQEVILKNADWIFIPKGRISYEGKEGTGSRFPSALIGIGVKEPEGLDGYTLFVKNAKVESESELNKKINKGTKVAPCSDGVKSPINAKDLIGVE